MQLNTAKRVYEPFIIGHGSYTVIQKIKGNSICSSLLPEAHLMKSFSLIELTVYPAEKYLTFSVHTKHAKVE